MRIILLDKKIDDDSRIFKTIYESQDIEKHYG